MTLAVYELAPNAEYYQDGAQVGFNKRHARLIERMPIISRGGS
jgi:hypothetical protein